MPGKRAFGMAMIELMADAVRLGRRHAPLGLDLPRSLLRDLNLPCCGPLPRPGE